jgi:hypothetical protein
MAASIAKNTRKRLLNFMSTSQNQHSTLGRAMNADLSLAELLALVEIVDEHVDRNFPGVDPPRVLREIQQKLDTVISDHRQEIDMVVKSARKARVRKK